MAFFILSACTSNEDANRRPVVKDTGPKRDITGELEKAVKLKGIAVTKGAREVIEKAGGTIEE